MLQTREEVKKILWSKPHLIANGKIEWTNNERWLYLKWKKYIKVVKMSAHKHNPHYLITIESKNPLVIKNWFYFFNKSSHERFGKTG